MNITWNAQNYKDNFCFVPQYGENVMELLTVPKGSRVVDLGCGNGTLTKKLAGRGYTVTGIDASSDMLDLARREHPDLTFLEGDALSFTLKEKADAIFSGRTASWSVNSVAVAAPRQSTLHWKNALLREDSYIRGPSTFQP